MKRWLITYNCMQPNNVEEERYFSLSANNISDALMFAETHVQEQIDKGEIEDAVIWNIGIIDDDVWSE